MNAHTLKDIRAIAPPQDRDCEALKLPPVVHSRPEGSRYIPCILRPRNLAELRETCGAFGDVAAKDAEWSAVALWLMEGADLLNLSNPKQIAIGSVQLCQWECRIAGFPFLNGVTWVSAMQFIPTATQAKAREVAAATARDWRQAECPYLRQSIDHTHKHITAYIRENPASAARNPD